MPGLEVADIFRAHGPTWRHTARGHFSLGQLKVMSAIEQCRSAALGGHSLRCSSCAQPGSALTHHPHVHGIVPGGGLAPDADRWVPCKPGFFLSVRVLSRLFRRRFLEELQNAHRAGQLKFFGEHIDLSDADALADWLAPMRQCEWVVYAKRPFAGPEQVLAYLSRYTHRVAISNSRLVALDDRGVTFRWKDYREHRRTRYKTMTLRTEEFMRRFLLHLLPSGFHRIRHYGLLANANRKTQIATARELLHQPAPAVAADSSAVATGTGSVRPTFVCRHCGAPMIVIETFARAQNIRGPPGSPSPP